MAARDYFYSGPIAERIGDYMQANGGLIAAGDFARLPQRWANRSKPTIAAIRFTKPVLDAGSAWSKHSTCSKVSI